MEQGKWLSVLWYSSGIHPPNITTTYSSSSYSSYIARFINIFFFILFI